MRIKKKILSLFTAFAMLMSLIPASTLVASAEWNGVGAENDPYTLSSLTEPEAEYSVDGGASWTQAETLAEVFAAADYTSAKNVRVRLLRDITANDTFFSPVSAGQSVTIDGQKHTISRGSNATHIFKMTKAGNLTFENITIDGGAVWDDAENLETRRNDGYSGDGNQHLICVDNTGATVTLGSGAVLQNNMLTAEHGAAAWVKNGELIMQDGAVIRNNTSLGSTESPGQAGAVLVGWRCKFTMNGGEITGNYANGVGGAIQNIGTMTINGGKIYKNAAGEDGGAILNQKELTMTSGEITENSANLGGGIQNGGSGSLFTMTGGKIHKNTVSDREADGFTFRGKGGGVYFFNTDTFTVSGTAQVVDNTYNGTPNNVYVPGPPWMDKVITVGGAFSEGASIGVTKTTAPAEGAPVDVTGTNDANYSAYFHSDNSAYQIVNSDTNVLQLAVKPPHTHTLVHYPAVPATCTEDGTGEYWKCEGDNGCNKMFSDKDGTTEISTIPITTATGHSYSTVWGKDENNHWYECSVCGDKKDVAVHTWNSGEITTEATCTTDGVKTYTCTECAYTKTETITAIGHDWNDWTQTIAPTCTTKGEETRTCKNDTTHIETREVAATGHSYSTVWSKDENSHWHECSVCGDKQDAAVHTWNSGEITTQATCTTDGVKTYTCTECAYTKTETITAIGHDWNDWTQTTAPTCTTKGEETRTCQNDTTHIETREVAATGHSYSTVWSKDENNHWYECSVCGDKQDVAVHTWNSGEITTEATCTTDGVKTYTCTECAYTKTETITAIGHDWNDWTQTIAPTCTTKGEETRTCKNDTTHIETREVAATGHSYSTVWSKDENNHWYECSVCGDKQDVAVHTWNSGEITTEATCTTDGVKTYTCTECAYTKTEKINATGHDWGKWMLTKDPTLTEMGTAKRVCTKDSSHEDIKTDVPPLSDTSVWTPGKKMEPTEEADGSQEYTSIDYGTVTVILTYIPTPTPTPKPHKGGGGSTISTSYLVTFNANNGDKGTSVKAEKNALVREPEAPIKEGYRFDGWYIDSELTEKYDFDEKVTESFTLYAKWIETTEPTQEPSVTPEPSASPEPTDVPKINPFIDVKPSDWFYDDVISAYKGGLMSGVSSTEFAPYMDITRGMFVTVLYRMEGEPQSDFKYTFDDVSSNEYYADAVAWGSENKIIKGYSAEIYAPEQIINREQMAAIIYRYAKFKGYDVSIHGTLLYSDSDHISDYAKNAVIWNSSNGIMQGNTDHAFTPQNYATRAEAAAVFVRITEKLK